MKLSLNNKFKSLAPFSIDLPDCVILTGLNGAGKTQILTAIIYNQLTTIEDNGIALDSKKYVTGQTLSPNESTIITRQHLNARIEELWNRYLNYINTKKNNPGIQLYHVLGNDSPHLKSVNQIAKNAGKNVDTLTSDDFFSHYPFNDGLDQTDVFYQNFSTLFKRYQDKYDENGFREFKFKAGKSIVPYLNEEEFIKKYGEAPWTFVNKIIKEANLEYHINTPEDSNRDAPFELKLISNLDDTEIKFGDLSSGEKVLMSLALALYNSNFDMEFPKVLLMDEPDASLHPSMSKKFLDVIQEVFVKEKKVKVIITTHSPSTVALAPEEALYIVNKTEPRIEKVSKDRALKILTTGVPSFSVNYENRRQIFVESAYDVSYYEKIYQNLSTYLIPEISLTFISSGDSRTDKNGTKVANCDQVVSITTLLRGGGNKAIFGIVDWDEKNTPSDGLFVLGNGNRYSIESYILDPIFVAALLLREKIINREDLNLSNNEFYTDFKNLSSEQLQVISDFITNKILPEIKTPNTQTLEVQTINGNVLSIPLWYLHHQGHDLEDKILKVFPGLNAIKKGKEEALKVAILEKVVDDVPELLSIDLLQVLQDIQQQ